MVSERAGAQRELVKQIRAWHRRSPDEQSRKTPRVTSWLASCLWRPIP
jgi:hypothetical protein